MDAHGRVVVVATVARPVALVPGDGLNDVQSVDYRPEREGRGGIVAKPAGPRRMHRRAVEQDALHWLAVHGPLDADEQPGVAVGVGVAGIAFDVDSYFLADDSGLLVFELGKHKRCGSRHDTPWLSRTSKLDRVSPRIVALVPAPEGERIPDIHLRAVRLRQDEIEVGVGRRQGRIG